MTNTIHTTPEGSSRDAKMDVYENAAIESGFTPAEIRAIGGQTLASVVEAPSAEEIQ